MNFEESVGPQIYMAKWTLIYTMTFLQADLRYRGTSCYRVSLYQDLVTRAFIFPFKFCFSRCYFKVSTQKVIWNKTLKFCSFLITCHQNLLHFWELFQFDPISAGNTTRELNTELSMATICIFIVAMVTILLAFHLPSSSPPQTHSFFFLSSCKYHKASRVCDS